MALPIISAEQRLAERRGVKGVVAGKSGIGKTSQLWTLSPMATYSQDTGSIYLACEGVVMEGPYARRKIWWNVGLHSAKGPTWHPPRQDPPYNVDTPIAPRTNCAVGLV